MHTGEWLYRLVVRGAYTVAPALGWGDAKLGRAIRGRARAVEELSRWAHAVRDPARPTLWFHAPSVGEALQARAVIEAIQAVRSDLHFVFTHFSPSAERVARAMPVDATAYLPWDVPGEVRKALDAVRPRVLAFTRTEVWPTLTRAAALRGARTAFVAATLPPGAGRARAPARWALRPTWERLDRVGAVSHEDGRGLVRLGVPAERVRVTGDPGIDSAHARLAAADPRAPWLAPFHGAPAPTVVAGSTWPADEAVLLPALAWARSYVPGLRVIVAPHEPTPPAVGRLLDRLSGEGWRARSLADVERDGDLAGADAVVVERVGVLASLYTAGTVAYVGGGLHRAGVHSVLEPAAAGLPVLVGPRHDNARAAVELVEQGGARVVDGVPALSAALVEWLTRSDDRTYASARALGYIDAHRGAAERTASLLLDLLY